MEIFFNESVFGDYDSYYNIYSWYEIVSMI